MAAVLRCGDEAALSHARAATLWGIAPDRRADRHLGAAIEPRPSPEPGSRGAALAHEMVVTHDGTGDATSSRP